MKVLVFNTKRYDQHFFDETNKGFNHTLNYQECHLDAATASLAAGCECVCAFVNDELDATTLGILHKQGVKLVALRCAGYNNVDLKTAAELNIEIVRVPAYSPNAVAEHTLALILALNRKVHRAHNRVREGNFALEGLLGFDIYGLTVGVIGTGRIGLNVIRILRGFGCKVLAYDPFPNAQAEQLGARYVALDALFEQADIISLHCPLTPDTHHLIDDEAVAKMKNAVMLINTSRGKLVDTAAVIKGLKSGKIGYLGLDVYEEEDDLFFEDLSDKVIQDDVFARLMTFPNVIVTGHQAFFTRDALSNIAHTTLQNIQEFEQTGNCSNRVTL